MCLISLTNFVTIAPNSTKKAAIHLLEMSGLKPSIPNVRNGLCYRLTAYTIENMPYRRYHDIMRYLRFFFLALFFARCFFPCPSAWALDFSYKFSAGDKYRIISTVTEDVFVNRKPGYKAEIVNRIALEVLSSDGGNARLDAVFQSAERAFPFDASLPQEVPGNEEPYLYYWSREYLSQYDQDRLGYITIGNEFFKPMVRDAPVFPGRAVEVGETWDAGGIEVHDFRDSLGIEEPYHIPFDARYTYLGVRSWKGSLYPAFSVSYRMFMEGAPVPGKVYPMRIQGASDQIVYWDDERGQVTAYEEYFRTILDLSDGQIWEYR